MLDISKYYRITNRLSKVKKNIKSLEMAYMSSYATPVFLNVISDSINELDKERAELEIEYENLDMWKRSLLHIYVRKPI